MCANVDYFCKKTTFVWWDLCFQNRGGGWFPCCMYYRVCSIKIGSNTWPSNSILLIIYHTCFTFLSITYSCRYIWTSGRKCNFAGCDRSDLQPSNVYGWFWSGSGVKIGPTNQRNSGDWSYTGGYNQAQPDNREAAQVINPNLLNTL